MNVINNVRISIFFILISTIPCVKSLPVVGRCNQYHQKNCDKDEFCDVVTNLCSSCSFLCDETDEGYLKMCKQMCPQVYSMTTTQRINHISHVTKPVTDSLNSTQQAVPKGGLWSSSLWMTITSAAVVALLLLPCCTLKYCCIIKTKCSSKHEEESIEMEAMVIKEEHKGSQDTIYIDLHPEKSEHDFV